MHLKSVYIKNFRSIDQLSFELNSGINLLVGPNAVGKTTVLEAIRLCKGLLAPRTQQESRQVLISLGAVSNALPNNFNMSAIARDPTNPIVITCDFALNDREVKELPGLLRDLTQQIVAAQRGISLNEGGQLVLIQFLSSPEGRQAYALAEKHVQDNIANATRSAACKLSLTIDPMRTGIAGEDLFSQILFATIESKLSPFRTHFSYFPADRAMPSGEVPIQLGTVDAQQQIESHNSNPALKYQRLKSTIFAAIVEGQQSRTDLEETFKSIFGELLKGRELDKFEVNRFGQASILVKDKLSGGVFDIDSMSSGEKGLILTFLILARSMEPRGVALIDEPELHLNPAVCKGLLGFLWDKFLAPNEVQAIICSHSPEILGAAMRSDKCSVFHMKAGTISEIRKRDQPEVAQALRLLGTSEVEEMLYEAVVFVEGPDDVDLLEAAFPDKLAKVKFRELSGRAEIEKQIKKLQEAEKEVTRENVAYFLFDRDRQPTGLESSKGVVIKQWNRYCLENYLLDPDVLFDVLRKEYKVGGLNLGEATSLFVEIAKKQLKSRVIEEVYTGFGYVSPDLTLRDKTAATFEDAAKILFARLDAARQQMAPLAEEIWTAAFVERCNAVFREREVTWSSSWQSECSGKQFFKDLYARLRLNAQPLAFKRRLLAENRLADDGGGTQNWKAMKEILESLLKGN
jgi:predicted ATP-binding protein involved in virulence